MNIKSKKILFLTFFNYKNHLNILYKNNGYMHMAFASIIIIIISIHNLYFVMPLINLM